MKTVWLDGEYYNMDEAKVSVLDRGYLFADGIYEVIAAYNNIPVMMEEHLDRWERSAEGIYLKQRYSREERLSVIYELIDRMGCDRTMIYGQLTRGSAPRTHQFPTNALPSEMWFVRELKPYPAEMYTAGVKALTHPDERWARCWVKSTSLLPNCLAKQFAMERDAFDVIMYLEDETVTESSAANAFCAKDGVLHTHPANGRILGGITRDMILRIAGEIGIEVSEKRFSLDFLKDADEVMISSTTMNMVPVTTLDGKPVGNGKPGEVFRKIHEAINAEIEQLTVAGT